MPQEIEIPPVDPGHFRTVLPPERFEEFEDTATRAREELADRVVWNVNSTARGGGVVELLRPLLGYARGAGVDARWMVIDGTPEFFTATKRIHNRLHGARGDGGPLDDDVRRVYEEVCAANVGAIVGRVREGDVVIVHDPQPAGMVHLLRDAGAFVIWRCHVGMDNPNPLAREAWDFLHSYVSGAHAYVFSRQSFAWESLDPERTVIIAPSIDAFAPKNADLDAATVRGVLQTSGIVADGDPGPVTFERPDGTPTRVERHAEMIEDERLEYDTPVVLQVSRWDRLKDPIGVIRGFAEHVPAQTGAHLVYAAPSTQAVADDPEGLRVLREAIAAREELAPQARRRIHFASLPLDDPEENAVMVNALQRHAAVIVQKSVAEGFGLTVAEGMWKARPVVASRIGGIQDQIVDGDSGVLVDPLDPAALAPVAELVADPARSQRIGDRARERVRDRFLSVRSLIDYVRLIHTLLECGGEPTPDLMLAGSSPSGGPPRA